MRSWILASTILAAANAAPAEFCVRQEQAGAAVPDASVAPAPDAAAASKPAHNTYDYVIVGGGVSGLTVANRLTENPKIQVLVIEAGGLDQGEDFVTIPALAGGAIGTQYDWNLTYAPNPQVNGNALPVAQGKVVGGGSILNRMIADRGSKSDYDRWASLGNPGWDFNGLLPYFKKSERFLGPLPLIALQYLIGFDPLAHGYLGNLWNIYSPYIWPSTKNYRDAIAELNIPIPLDGANGNAIGGYWTTRTQDPTDNTRDSARTAEYDPVKGRSNLKLLTKNQVTKLITSSSKTGLKVTAVEYATGPGAPKQTAYVSREAILAAGSLHTPQVLQLSGIGPASVLSKAGVKQVLDLPGAGFNLQDHPYFPVPKAINVTIQSPLLANNASFAAQARAQYDATRQGPYADATGNFLAFLPYKTITSNTGPAISLASSGSDYLSSDVPATVKAGYAAQKSILTQKLSATDSAVMEFLYADDAMVNALQHPFSRGSVQIKSADPFAAPTLDSGFFKHPADIKIMVEGFKWVRKVMATKALQSIGTVEIVPGPAVQSDADIEAFIRGIAGSLWHPVGSCAMLPKASGGCVDTSLKVYGATNLRIVDASVFPLLPATHIQTTVYAIAEKAADLIKAAQ